jgi:hypothetical protein
MLFMFSIPQTVCAEVREHCLSPRLFSLLIPQQSLVLYNHHCLKPELYAGKEIYMLCYLIEAFGGFLPIMCYINTDAMRKSSFLCLILKWYHSQCCGAEIICFGSSSDFQKVSAPALTIAL